MLKRIKFQDVIEKVLEVHGLLEDFYSERYGEVLIELSMKHFDDLTIKRNGNIIAAGHYYVMKKQISCTGAEQIIKRPDPILNFVLQEENVWVPFKSELMLTTFQCAYFEETCGYPLITRENHTIKKDIIEFSKFFAKNIEEQGWYEAEVKQVIRIDKVTSTFQEKINSYRSIKEDVKLEIIEAINNEVLPRNSKAIAQLCGKYERLWVHEYKGFHYVIGDPLVGYYIFDSMLDEFLKREHISEEELYAKYTVKSDIVNY